MSKSDVYGRFRASVDIGMGVIYMVVSFYATQTAYIVENYGKGLSYSISLLFFMYGLFRVYRGFNAIKQSMKPEEKPQDRMARFKAREAEIQENSAENSM